MSDRHGGVVRWIHDRSLTLVMLGLFAVFLVGQIAAGWSEYNQGQSDHGLPAVTLFGYFTVGHFWEALFENWESEFLQMAAFISLTTFLYQKGSPESRRPGVTELVDADPREYAYLPGVPWPVKRGGWILTLYERSLGLALFLCSSSRGPGTLSGVGGISARSGTARTGRRGTGRLRHVEPLLVRVVSELAERISLGSRDGMACGLPAAAWLSGVQACSCLACRNRAMTNRSTLRCPRSIAIPMETGGTSDARARLPTGRLSFVPNGQT